MGGGEAARGAPAGGDPDLFRGTAWFYARYRPDYPAALFDVLVEAFGLDGTGCLVDLGAGTGAMCLPLAHHVANVVAIDPDADMLAEARREAGEQGITNIAWRQGRAEETEIAP